MLNALFVALLVCASAAPASLPASFDVSGYAHHKELLSTTYFELWWTLGPDYIDIAIATAQTGWFGFGLANQASIGMIGADIVTMYVDANGEATVVDRASTYQHILPRVDSCQDWAVKGAGRENGWQFVELRRWRDTGDEFFDKKILTGDHQAVIFAFGGNGNTEVAYHGTNHYQAYVNWDPTTYVEPSIPADAYTIDLKMNAYVPTDTTTYRCRGLNLTNALKNPGKKSHIIKIEAILDFPDVHHILMRKCTQAEGFWQFYHDNPGETCWGHFTLPGELAYFEDNYRSVALASTCSEVLYSWTVGNIPWYLPNEVGFSTDDASLFLLEVHYNNHNHVVKTQNDTTALRLTVTETLRKYDCAYTVGADPIVFLPPLPPAIPFHRILTSCPGACTMGFPGPITIFAVQIHAHSYNRGGSMAIYRNGKFVADVISTAFYKFDNQNTINVPPVVLLPGDEILFSCAWNTTTSSTPIMLSENSYDEMCGILFFWYPRLAQDPKYPLAAGMPGCGAFMQNATVCGYGPMPIPQPYFMPTAASQAEHARLDSLRYLDWAEVHPSTCRPLPPVPQPSSSAGLLVGYVSLAILCAWLF